MESQADMDKQMLCPYNLSHNVMRRRMEQHLVKCRRNYREESGNLTTCDFNACHRVPVVELQFHHSMCPDRKHIEIHVMTEAAPQTAPIEITPAGFVPIDNSWDDSNLQSYDPVQYCNDHAVIRRLDTGSAAQKREFRDAERQRISNLAQQQARPNGAALCPAVRQGHQQAQKISLPPTPRYRAVDMEAAPEQINRMISNLQTIPKAAVIPKK